MIFEPIDLETELIKSMSEHTNDKLLSILLILYKTKYYTLDLASWLMNVKLKTTKYINGKSIIQWRAIFIAEILRRMK